MTSTSINPLREGRSGRKPAEPCSIVVLGATGDLTGRKLIPALFNLFLDGHLPARFVIVGFARRPKSDAEFREDLYKDLCEFSRVKPRSREEAEEFLAHVHYQQGNLDCSADFDGLRGRLESLEAERSLPANRLFYFAIAPEFFETVISLLQGAGLSQPANPDRAWTRMIIEKPFGEDLASARELNRKVQSVFDESQVYRIDHYLGKETVQNLLAFRFANSIFEPLWSSRYIDHVQITMGEEVGMPGRRGQYFDKAGILRDVVQNHVLQLLCLTAMEPPASLDADSLRDEKVRVLRAIRTMSVEEVAESVVRGQYGAGSLRGKECLAYRAENQIEPDSVTETYVAWRLEVKNWRWAGVPFLLRAGKRLPKRATEIAVIFKHPPHQVFDIAPEFRLPNTLALRIQPDEGIAITFSAKQPGLLMNLQPVQMDFRYGTSFGSQSPEAYERLLLDGIVGDGSLFTRGDEVEEAWRLCTAILDGWKAMPRPTDFPNYDAGSWGPTAADRLTADLASGWRKL
ncbi:glucose-6-phosphate dehydrogenase [bacterium]|nr:glucose-6-phosphate dehydrogenase [bacterium]